MVTMDKVYQVFFLSLFGRESELSAISGSDFKDSAARSHLSEDALNLCYLKEVKPFMPSY